MSMEIPVYMSRRYLKEINRLYSTLLVRYIRDYVIEEGIEESFDINIHTCDFLPVTGFTVESSLDKEITPYCYPVNMESLEEGQKVFGYYNPEQGLYLCLSDEIMD